MKKYMTKTIESLTEFIKFVESHCRTEDTLFRGQETDQPLVPRIGRLKIDGGLLEVERAMLAEFQRLSYPFLPQRLESEWEWLALMQHHGMATRLLDWTKNPLAALWFAVHLPPKSKKQSDLFSDSSELVDGVVWMFEPPEGDILMANAVSKESPFGQPWTRIFQPRSITERIVAQSGWFTVHCYNTTKSKGFLPLEENPRYKKHLTKLLIPPRFFADMRANLDRLGVNHASMFPGIDGLCRHVEWLHSKLSDEHDSGGNDRAQSPKRTVTVGEQSKTCTVGDHKDG